MLAVCVCVCGLEDAVGIEATHTVTNTAVCPNWFHTYSFITCWVLADQSVGRLGFPGSIAVGTHILHNTSGRKQSGLPELVSTHTVSLHVGCYPIDVERFGGQGRLAVGTHIVHNTIGRKQSIVPELVPDIRFHYVLAIGQSER